MHVRRALSAMAITVLMAVGISAPASYAGPGDTVGASAGKGTVAVIGMLAWSDCGNYPGTICLFANNNWGLPIWRQYPSQIGSCRNLTGFDNVTTMAVNGAGGHTLVLWRYLGCTGESLVITSGNYADLTGTWWNDKPSSVQVIAF